MRRRHRGYPRGLFPTASRSKFSLALLALLASLAFQAWLLVAHAVNPGERLQDPGQEARARELSQELRCLVCQNQSIDDSNAELARDLRVLVRERIVAGDTDAQVIDFVTSRYGDFVLLRPPVRAYTWALWFGPPVLLAIALAAVLLRRRRPAELAPPPLSDDERRRLDALLADREGKRSA
jgi:cytochrome c-type biogenesis protein CcmH